MIFDKEKLIPDCAACDALCCVAPDFDTSNYRKPAGVPCRNLDLDTLGCQIYKSREALSFTFCANFNCLGAGQAVTELFRDFGRNWRSDEKIAKVEYDVFLLVYLHLSNHLFPGRQQRIEVDRDAADRLESFKGSALDIIFKTAGMRL
ncbi:MAG: hypothetical protein HQ503_17990 [Rhodospirillales bacterium]|nr:hypothetical protein [Rhodospirillales bacterium]